MRGSIIFGATAFSELLIAHLRADLASPPPVAAAVDSDYLDGRSEFSGLPLISAEDMAEIYPSTDYGVYVTIGYKRMNVGRQKAYTEVGEQGYNILSYVHPSAQILTTTTGVGLVALQNVTIDRFCHVGRGNILQIGVTICHHSTVGDFNFFGPGATVAGKTRIGDGCFLGANCVVRNGVTLGDRTLVGAGAYVSHDTPPGSVIVPSHSVILPGLDSSKMDL